MVVRVCVCAIMCVCVSVRVCLSVDVFCCVCVLMVYRFVDLCVWVFCVFV